MFNAGNYMISIAEVKAFITDADKIFTVEELDELRTHLAQFPDSGDIIPDTGGVRKLRHGAKGQGKRGGARVIYYFRDLNVPVYLLAVYTKGEKITLTHRDKRAMRQMVEQITDAALGTRLRVVNRA
jgi:hypothetical protein